MRILECSSKGDKRFSAFYAVVTAFGKTQSIEDHYQLAKRFGEDSPPTTWRDAKGKKPTHFELNGYRFPLELMPQYYDMLWYLYLGKNPQLVAYAEQYDHFTDMFRGKSLVCQANTIRDYVKNGSDYVLNRCKPFLEAIAEIKTAQAPSGNLH